MYKCTDTPVDGVGKDAGSAKDCAEACKTASNALTDGTQFTCCTWAKKSCYMTKKAKVAVAEPMSDASSS